MAITEAFSNSATIGTAERFLASNSTTATYQTDDGVYQLFIDFNNVAAGDIFQVRVYEKVTSGGAADVVYIDNVTGPLDSPHYASPSLIFLHGWEFSLTKIAGTDRVIPWSIRKVA
jgi:hypothetical protein